MEALWKLFRQAFDSTCSIGHAGVASSIPVSITTDVRPIRKIMRTYRTACVLVLLSCSFLSATPRRTVSLDGSDWRLAGVELATGESLGIPREGSARVRFQPVAVPNDVQLTVLKDPYGQDSEITEINRREWWYVRSFLSPDHGTGHQVRLVFDGVDYFADVWLNGQKLGSHEGAFTRF